MTKRDDLPGTGRARRSDLDNWAPLVDRLQVSGAPEDAPNLVEGRRLVGPLQGFGRMWQKTYRVRLQDVGVTPAELIATWKERFAEFWPPGNRFYAPLTGIAPGEVALLSVAAGPMRLSTGVMVLYGDEESFTLMTPQGHMLAAWITFSAYEEQDSVVAQVQALLRTQDPLSELGFALGGHRQEDRFWEQTLRSLAAHFGDEPAVEQEAKCIDTRRNWSHAGNVWHNVGIRSTLYTLGGPVRWAGRSFRRTSRGD